MRISDEKLRCCAGVLALALVGCKDTGQQPPQPKVTERDLDTANHELGDAMDKYVAATKQKLSELGDRIDALAHRTDEPSRREADKLRTRRDELQSKLDHAHGQPRSSWDQLKKDVEDGFDSLKRDLDKTTQD